MLSLARFKQHSFHDSIITECRNHDSYSCLRGEFSEDEIERGGAKKAILSEFVWRTMDL